VVFFLVDDLGWGAMGAYGNQYHETPHFDALCARGMRFTTAYSACTVCSPSRAAILTGQYPGRTNLTDWIPGHRRPEAKLKIPDWKRFMDHSHTTLPEALQQAGYRTGFFGKWHLVPIEDQQREQPETEHTPQDHGFDVNIGGREWGQPRGRGRYFYPFDMPGLEEGEEGEYLTDRLTDEAVQYLEESTSQPFLLYLSYYTVHSPVMAKPEDLQYFTDKPRDKEKTATGKTNPAAYAAMHKALDDSVGRVVAKLEALGQLDNTILVFTGDNGSDFNTSCGGLRGIKGLAFEGGVREPTCVVWPGVTEPGSVCDTPIIGTDFFPTLLAMAGLPQLPEQHLDGENLEPLLRQTGALQRDTLYWHYPHYHRTKPYGAIRQGDWKLIEFFEDGELLLFDLKNDPAEQHDLAATHPEKRQELLANLLAWRAEVGAQMPTERAPVE
jgi:arylsulfatase A-like enzyme